MKPMLAQTWELAPDVKSATVKLTQGVTWHKGYGDFTADDVVYTLTESNPRQTKDCVHDTAGDIAAFLDTVEKVDKYTVKLNFWSYFSPAQSKIFSTFWETVPMFSKKVFDEKGPEAMKEFLIGTGPFTVEKWVLQEGAYVNAVDKHWRKTPYVARLEMIQVVEGSVRRAMLETGEIQVAPLDPKDQPAMLAKGYKRQPEGYFSRLTIGMAGNMWETKHYVTGKDLNRVARPDWPWVGNPADPASMEKAKKVRQAMSMDIDRDGLAAGLMKDVGRPFYMYEISTDDPNWQAKWKVAYDPKKAKQLLTEAGYPNGFTFKWRSDPASPESDISEALASTWLTDLNIKTEITKVAYSTFRPSIIDHTAIPWFCGDGVSTFPTLWPKGLTLSSLSDGGYNCNIESPVIAKIFSTMAGESDQAKLKTLANEFFDYLNDQQLVIGVVEYPAHGFYDPKKIVEWKMRPEGKGTGVINSPEWIKLAP
jgi:peptide/nickel transport system substrate-binding protein